MFKNINKTSKNFVNPPRPLNQFIEGLKIKIFAAMIRIMIKPIIDSPKIRLYISSSFQFIINT